MCSFPDHSAYMNTVNIYHNIFLERINTYKNTSTVWQISVPAIRARVKIWSEVQSPQPRLDSAWLTDIADPPPAVADEAEPLLASMT